MKTFVGAAIAGVMAIASCAPSTSFKSAQSETITRVYKLAQTSTRDKATTTLIAVRAKDIGGKFGLCVAVSTRGSSTFQTEWPKAIADKLIVELAGNRVTYGTPFAATYLDLKSLIGKKANCAITDAPWKTKYRSVAPVLDLPAITLTA
jgi:hypothetical protein